MCIVYGDCLAWHGTVDSAGVGSEPSMAGDDSSLFCDDTIQRHTEQQCSRHHRLPHRAGGHVLYFVEEKEMIILCTYKSEVWNVKSHQIILKLK